jgi:hypothetical protein
VSTSLYVDDFAIFYGSWGIDTIERRLQLAIHRLSRWALENGFSFSRTKSLCVHFTRLRGLHPHPTLFLENSALPFVLSLKFLGLFLDRKLSWEPHLRWLHVKCQGSLNMSKVLSGRSWGGDRTASTPNCPLQVKLWQLRVSLRHESKLSIIDPVHNMGIRLATGAFRTSRMESLYVESGEPPLSLRRNLLLCGYAAKLATQPYHAAYGAIFRLALCSRYELNTRAPRPAGVRLHQLLQQLNIRLPHIIPCRLSRIPPWEIVRPTCDLRLISHPRSSTSPLTYRRCFAELLSSYPDYTAVYTDGSFLRESTGSAFVYGGAAFSCLHNFNSVFTAELYALYRALLFLRRQPRQCHLMCTDSLSALQSLISYSRDHPIANEIQYQLSHLQKAESLFYSAGYVATLACPAMRPLMVQLERLHCTETWLLIQLSAVMFAPSSTMLFYRHGKMNGLTLKATNCDWWSHPYRHGVPLSALSGRRKSISHGYESVTHAWHMAICCEVSLPASVMTLAAHWLCHTFW